jgi:exonuclease III
MFSEVTGEVTSKRLQTPANPMRIATFNLESFGYARKASAAFEERAEVLRPQLERLKADVLCLQEVDAPKIGTTRRPVNLERLLEGTSYAGHALAISSGSSGGVQPTCTISRC